MPFRIENGRAYGPGVFDMKANLVVMREALAAIKELKLRLSRPVKILLSCDEESGSPTSRDLIEAEAAGCAAALVFEPSLPGGVAKTARKGIAGYQLTARGIAAHAGVDPDKGASAVAELAHQIVALHQLNDPPNGVSVNAGVICGGTYSNVIAAEAQAQIDVRFRTMAQGEAVMSRIRALQPALANTSIELTGGLNRPPLERSPGVVALYEQARRLAAELGFELGEGSTGGGSDGNFTAALGIPTLDGLGVEGSGAHAAHEHIVIADLPRRAALLVRLLMTL
jgi:glutamate carboxypeptidase